MEMCKRVVQHMLRHQLLMAWYMFVDCVFSTQHNRQTVSKVLSRMQHRRWLVPSTAMPERSARWCCSGRRWQGR